LNKRYLPLLNSLTSLRIRGQRQPDKTEPDQNELDKTGLNQIELGWTEPNHIESSRAKSEGT